MAELNTMCNRCTNTECPGTTNKVWTGCIYRQTDTNAGKGHGKFDFVLAEDHASELLPAMDAEPTKHGSAFAILQDYKQRHRGNYAAMYADLANQCAELADIAETDRETKKLDALILARDTVGDILIRDSLKAQGYVFDTGGTYPKWTKAD